MVTVRLRSTAGRGKHEQDFSLHVAAAQVHVSRDVIELHSWMAAQPKARGYQRPSAQLARASPTFEPNPAIL